MIVIPALDLREGACVQLVGGRYEDERIRLDDPLAVARDWRGRGFTTLHVVDLDAATGRGSNAAVIRAVLAEPGLECQVGGGVREEAAIASLLAAGARRVVVGTRAIEDADWLARTARAFPDRLLVAADVRGRDVVTHGWQRGTGSDVRDVLARLDALPLAGVLVTAVHREGRLAGADIALMTELAGQTRLPLHASGGITTMDDLHTLARIGVAAAILGLAIYSGALDPTRLAEEFVP